MPFDKVDTQVDFPAQERSILQLWDDIQAFEKLRAKNRGKPRWSFLDGPITANNPMGVHHAWGRTYKDAYQRYFAMTGHELRYQNGFDCQGLWVEVEVEKELKLKSKRDIENLVDGDKFKSIDFFVNACKTRVNTFARRQTEQSIRLGQWMDWDRTDADWAKPPGERKSYFTMADENNYTIWSFLKKCHDRKLIYKSYDSMPWCGRCGTGISQQEMNEGYQLVAHRSVFVKFPLRPSPTIIAAFGGGRPAENLLIWTTTPWTLSSNVGAAVNPTLTYLKVKHKDEIYYLAKGAFTAQRLEEQFKRKEWLEGVPKLKTLEQIFKEKGGYEIVGEILGKDMVGWQYDGPFDELAAQDKEYGYPEEIANVVKQQKIAGSVSARNAHQVVSWHEVGETEGTGIVHIAPGCGKEDFELAVNITGARMQPDGNIITFPPAQDGSPQGNVCPNGLPPIAPLDDSGIFLEGFGELTGKSANDPATTDWILDNLQKKGRLLAVEKYPHSYPHCWRCKTELLFRLVDEWFIDMDKPYPETDEPKAFRYRIMDVTKEVTFLPESINGRARELDWLKNMGDWMISKKRYWGLALPIWVDEESGDFEVIGSYAELKERAVEGWDQFAACGEAGSAATPQAAHTPHRPWIDLVKIKNPKTGNLMTRVPDVGNPWLDAGIVPFSTMKYNSDRDYWKQWFPAHFITEAFPGQFRNWFYAILTMSTMLEQQAPMKVLLGHGMVRDDQGDEMHKAKGNSIPFEGAANDGYEIPGKDGKMHEHPPMGSDLMRWMYCRNNPAANINFGPTIAEEVRSKFIMKLWNTYAFFCNYARLDEFDAATRQAAVSERPDIDRWILSDLQLLIQTAHDAFQSFNVMAFCLKAEEFVDDKLSNWYVRRNRRRFWKAEKGADKLAAYQTLYTVLVTLVKLCAPVVPFMTEKMYQNLSEPEALAKMGSIHLCDYPIADETLIDHELSAEMDALLRLVSLGGSARNAVKIKVRQPLAEIKIQPANDAEKKAVERFADQIRDELNIKKVTLHDSQNGPLLSFEVKLNPKAVGPKFGPKLAAVQAALAIRTDIVQTLQAGKPVELQLPDGPVMIESADVWITPKVEKGCAGIADHGTQILLDGRITPELELEGLAREVVRHVQNARKDAALEMDDRIALYLETSDAKLAEAIKTHRDYIANETLIVQWATAPLADSYSVDVKIEGVVLKIQLKKSAT